MVLAIRDAEPVVARARAERRRFLRVRLDMPGRLFTPGDGRETHCTVLDLSAGGASVTSDTALAKGLAVVLYVNGFGRFEGTVVRPVGRGFGILFSCTQAKRERTAEQLTLHLNRALVDDMALRRHERTSQKGFARFTRADGQIVECEVLDISAGGVSLGTDLRPPVGEFVLIAGLAGRIVRHHGQGIGIEFIGQPVGADPLKPSLVR